MSSLWMRVCMSAFVCLVLVDFLAAKTRSTCDQVTGAGDISSKTLRAKIVFEGEAKRITSPPHRPNSSIVEFKVHQVVKGDGVKRSQVAEVGYFHQQELDYNRTIGSRFLVFVDGPSNPRDHPNPDLSSTSSRNSTRRFYHLSSSPEEFSNKKMKDVRSHACPKCGRPPKVVKETKSQALIEGQKLKLHCRASGRPSPCITWYKDGVEVKPGKRITIKEHRRDSRLQLRKFVALDSGIYRCQATNLLGNASSRDIRVRSDDQELSTSIPLNYNTTLKPHSDLCRDQSFCFNGGSCYEVSKLKQHYCVCAKHFDGLRCEEKQTGKTMATGETYHKRRKKKRNLDGHRHHPQQKDGAFIH